MINLSEFKIDQTRKSYRIFMFPLFLVMLISCDTCHEFDICPEPKLPTITMDGLNTFGCKINGIVWLPCQTLGLTDPPLLYSYQRKSQELTIVARHDYTGLGSESLDLNKTITDTGFYKLKSNPKSGFNFQTFRFLCEYYTVFDTNSYNFINITKLDSIDRIISGVFELHLLSSKCSDTINITEGRFDIKYGK